MFVHESKPLEDLVGDVSDRGLWEGFGSVLDHLIQVLLHVLKSKVELIALSDHLPQPDNVHMLQFQQRLQRMKGGSLPPCSSPDIYLQTTLQGECYFPRALNYTCRFPRHMYVHRQAQAWKCNLLCTENSAWCCGW